MKPVQKLVFALAVAAIPGRALAAAPETSVPQLHSIAELPIIKPGQVGLYPVYVPPPITPKATVLGKLHGRRLVALESPAKVSGMGKYMAVDKRNGDIWYVEAREDKVIRIDPKTSEMTEYELPRGASPYAVSIDSKGHVWMTGHGIEMLLELDPKVPSMRAHEPPSHGFLIHVNVAADDTVWFTQPGNNQLVSYRDDVGFKEYPPPTKQSGPGRHDFDKEGNVWFPELYTNKLGEIDIGTGKIREWDLPTPNALPAGVRVDRKDHDAIWVSEPMADKLAIFRNGKFKEYKIPTVGSVVSTNVTDAEGNVWFTEGGWRGSAGGNKLGWLDPRTGKVEEFLLPYENSQPLGIVNGLDGSMWFTLVTGGHVVHVLPEGQ